MNYYNPYFYTMPMSIAESTPKPEFDSFKEKKLETLEKI